MFFEQNSEAMISIDMPAGPSEVLVIADRHANPVHIAADLLSQVTLMIPSPSNSSWNDYCTLRMIIYTDSNLVSYISSLEY